MTLLSTLQSARLGMRHPLGVQPTRLSALARLFGRITRAHLIWQERQHLLSLDPSLLDDIGLNRGEAMAEAARPIWDVPKTWRL